MYSDVIEPVEIRSNLRKHNQRDTALANVLKDIDLKTDVMRCDVPK